MFLLRRPLLPFALALGLGACQSPSSQTQTATAPATPAQPAAAPAALGPESSPGASYTTYRGAIAGQPDSLTLHLVTTPQAHYDNPGPTSQGSYSGPDGHPYDIGSRRTTPDSLVLVDYSPEHGASPTTTPPEWRLKRQADGSLVGTAGSQAVQLRPVPPAGGLTFAVRTFADSLAAFPGRAGSPKARISLQALAPVGGPAMLAAGLLRDLRGDTTAALAPLPLADLFRQQRDSLFSSYRDDVRALATDAPSPDEQPSATLNYDSQQTMHVLFRRGNLLSLAYFGYEYTGGAHGMNYTFVASYDLRTGRRLRYADIFRPEADQRLPALLAGAVRSLLSIPAGEPLDNTLLVKKLPITHNVFLTSGGVEFVYQPYEIAAYALGEVRVFLPLGQVRALLQPGLPLPEAAGVAAR